MLKINRKCSESPAPWTQTSYLDLILKEPWQGYLPTATRKRRVVQGYKQTCKQLKQSVSLQQNVRHWQSALKSLWIFLFFVCLDLWTSATLIFFLFSSFPTWTMCMFREHKENWQMEEVSSLVPLFVLQRDVGPLCVLPMTSRREAGTKRLRTQGLSVHLLHGTWQKCLNGWSFHGIAHFCSLGWWSSTSSENNWVRQNYQWWPAWLWDTQRQSRGSAAEDKLGC